MTLLNIRPKHTTPYSQVFDTTLLFPTHPTQIWNCFLFFHLLKSFTGEKLSQKKQKCSPFCSRFSWFRRLFRRYFSFRRWNHHHIVMASICTPFSFKKFQRKKFPSILEACKSLSKSLHYSILDHLYSLEGL